MDVSNALYSTGSPAPLQLASREVFKHACGMARAEMRAAVCMCTEM